jgi:DNA-binding NarL/FixJ family response regulator
MSVRILLADDQALFREGLDTLLSAHRDIEVIGQASNGQEVVDLALRLRPDVILMDMQMPILNGIVATRRLKQSLPECRIIMLTTFSDNESVFDALRAGAVGYLLKDVGSAQLAESIRATARGESILDPSVAAKLVAEFSRVSSLVGGISSEILAEPLSEREIELLRLIASGLNNKEIGETLFITEGTVKNHITHILGKLGVRDRTQAALKARELGLM